MSAQGASAPTPGRTASRRRGTMRSRPPRGVRSVLPVPREAALLDAGGQFVLVFEVDGPVCLDLDVEDVIGGVRVAVGAQMGVLEVDVPARELPVLPGRIAPEQPDGPRQAGWRDAQHAVAPPFLDDAGAGDKPPLIQRHVTDALPVRPALPFDARPGCEPGDETPIIVAHHAHRSDVRRIACLPIWLAVVPVDDVAGVQERPFTHRPGPVRDSGRGALEDDAHPGTIPGGAVPGAVTRAVPPRTAPPPARRPRASPRSPPPP